MVVRMITLLAVFVLGAARNRARPENGGTNHDQS